MEANLDISNPQQLLEEIKNRPSIITEFIKKIDDDLKTNKANIEEIQGRNFFQKLVASNTSDLAEVIMEQSKIMTNFFTMLQMVTFLCKGNSALMLKIMGDITAHESLNDQERGTIFTVAKSYFEDATKSMQNEQIRETALRRALVNVYSLNQSRTQHETAIENMAKNITEIEASVNELKRSSIWNNSIFRIALVAMALSGCVCSILALVMK
ncbi:MAG: hypothetical protein LIP03_13385 [Bacteroidales bacterium]|nr:hypothetical protein [Bacteroidales bacterium]